MALGTGCAADGPALLSRRPGTGHRTRSSSKVSISLTKTTSPALAHRLGVAANQRDAAVGAGGDAGARTSRATRGGDACAGGHGRRAQTLHQAGVFGHTFALPDRAAAKQARIEEQLDFLFDFYEKQRDQHSWYGFWNYGDVMHTYDADRHTWRYDVGGYAWDNSELSTDIWLWLYFLRTGRADVYRFAEAMTRHTGEVDVHHLGKFAPLGSRHNVMHWGCSAKQLRISTALNRRYYYFLTADERVGDLLREQLEAARTLRSVVPERKLPEAQDRPRETCSMAIMRDLGFGTDWGSIAGAWLTEWERTGSREMRDRLVASMRSIGSQPRGFFTGGGRMNLRTGEFDIAKDKALQCFSPERGLWLPEVCAELIELLKIPEFERAWVQYCTLYNAPPELQKAELGESLGELNLGQGHSRLTAYASEHDTRSGVGAPCVARVLRGACGIQAGSAI